MWGTSFAVTKSAYAVLSPMVVVWLRMIAGLIAFLPLFFFVKRPQYRHGDWKRLGLSMLFLPCLYFALEGFALKFTSSNQAGVISAIMPLTVVVIAWVFLRDRPQARTVAAAVVSVIGVVVLSTTGNSQLSAPNPLLGNLLELGAMLAAAGATLTIKDLTTRYDPLLLAGLQMASGSIFFTPLAIASGPVEWATIPATAWLSVVYLGVGCGFAAFWMYNSGLRRLPASRAALAINVIPAVALLTGWLALKETMSIPQILACTLIIGAVVYAQWPGSEVDDQMETSGSN